MLCVREEFCWCIEIRHNFLAEQIWIFYHIVRNNKTHNLETNNIYLGDSVYSLQFASIYFKQHIHNNWLFNIYFYSFRLAILIYFRTVYSTWNTILEFTISRVNCVAKKWIQVKQIKLALQIMVFLGGTMGISLILTGDKSNSLCNKVIIFGLMSLFTLAKLNNLIRAISLYSLFMANVVNCDVYVYA